LEDESKNEKFSKRGRNSEKVASFFPFSEYPSVNLPCAGTEFNCIEVSYVCLKIFFDNNYITLGGSGQMLPSITGEGVGSKKAIFGIT